MQAYTIMDITRVLRLVIAVLLVLSIGGSASIASSDFPMMRVDQLPIAFTANQGQWDSEVAFRASVQGTVMWFAADGIYYQIFRDVRSNNEIDEGKANSENLPKREVLTFKASFVGGNPNCAIRGGQVMEYKCNYFIGDDQSTWQTGVPNFEAITYQNVYDGIDLKILSNGSEIESYFAVASGADPTLITLRFEGVDSVAIDSESGLSIATTWGIMQSKALKLRQEGNHEHEANTVNYNLVDDHSVRLEFDGNYDKSRAMMLGPSLAFSTYVGGAGNDYVFDLATNSAGEAIVTGATSSADFPLLGAFDSSVASSDGFVTKFNASGTGLIFSTYIGGSTLERCTALSLVNSATYAIFLTGFTDSPDFPTIASTDPTPNGSTDGFVVVINAAGNSLIFGAYLGGSNLDLPGDIAVQCIFPCATERFTVWVTGYTYSSNFPFNNGYSGTLSGTTDAFLTQYTIGITGNSMGRSTYFGGSDSEAGRAVILGGGTSGRPYIGGYTTSANFPTAGAYDNSLSGTYDAFLAQFDYSGTGPMTLVFSTYLGGSSSTNEESIFSLVLRNSGNVAVAGRTSAADFPTLAGYDNSYNGGSYDGFIAEFTGTGSSLVSSSYFGGSGTDVANKIVQDFFGNIYVTGQTGSSDFPLVGAYDVTLGGSSDAFVAKLSSSMTTLQFSTFLGGTSTEYGTGITADTLGCIYAAGLTSSSNFPVASPFDMTGTGDEGYLTKLCLPAYLCGDADGNGLVTISDAVYLINYIFAGGPAPNPLLSGDVDCNAIVTISDAVYLINYIFSGGPAPCASCL